MPPPSVSGDFSVSGAGPGRAHVAAVSPSVSAVRMPASRPWRPPSASRRSPGVSAQGNASVAPGAFLWLWRPRPAVSGVAQGSVSGGARHGHRGPGGAELQHQLLRQRPGGPSLGERGGCGALGVRPATAHHGASGGTITVTAPAPAVLGQRNPPSIAAPAVAVTLSRRRADPARAAAAGRPCCAGGARVAMPAPSASSVEAVVVEDAAMSLSLTMVKPTAWVELPDVPADHRMRVRWESRTMVIPATGGAHASGRA